MDEKRKTSISFPAPAENLCGKHYATVMANLAFYLRYLRRHQPSRQKLRTHNDGSQSIIIVRVYWDMCTYNWLHSLALLCAAVCLPSLAHTASVTSCYHGPSLIGSYLICVMLMLAEDRILPGAEGLDPEDRGRPFSNCDMKVNMWGAAGYIYKEFLLFSSSKPPNTAKPVAQNSGK